MKYDLQGSTMQILNMEIEGDDSIVSESGRLIYMSDVFVVPLLFL